MKRCPECRRDYHDDTLSFCLADGTELVYGLADEPATAIFPDTSSSSEARTRAHVYTTGDEPGVGGSRETQHISANRWPKLLPVVALIAVLVGGFFAYRYFFSTGTNQIESIAVMPFANESGSPDLEYLSDGMTETLISSLSQLANLSVKARSSVFRFKGKDMNPRAIGEELNVQTILNGRVLQRDDGLVLHVELIDARTENVIWKGDYTRPMVNLVQLQTEIARDVSDKLRAKLTGDERRQIAKTYTNNAEAYQLYLQGRFHWNKRKPAEHLKAVEFFERAIALDSNYALAYSGIADCYAVDSAPEKGEAGLAKVKVAAEKALEIDPTLGQPHAALASVFAYNFDWSGAEREYKKAIELDPTYATGHQWYAEFLTRMGRHDEAAAEINRALELDPLSIVINSDRAYLLIMARRYDEAVAQARKTLELEPNWNAAYGWLIFAYEMSGRFEDAMREDEIRVQTTESDPEVKADLLKAIAEARESYKRSGPPGYWRRVIKYLEGRRAAGKSLSSYYFAEVYALVGDKDEAFKSLDDAINQKETQTHLIKVSPSFDNLRTDSRWPDLLRRMNLAE
jgi:TolB-like protein/Flp pilus assembly protein TadD